jgi:hypothetical protein
MKKYLFILLLSLSASFAGFSQDDSLDRGNKLADRMKEYIQKRLNLSTGEAEKFSPVFMRYLLELKRTHRENSGDRPVLQLKIAELRVRFRSEFRQILDEQRANKIYEYEREFQDKVKQEVIERRLNRRNGPRIRDINPRAI